MDGSLLSLSLSLSLSLLSPRSLQAPLPYGAAGAVVPAPPTTEGGAAGVTGVIATELSALAIQSSLHVRWHEVMQLL